MSEKYECRHCRMTFEEGDFPLDDGNTCPFCDATDAIRPFDGTDYQTCDGQFDTVPGAKIAKPETPLAKPPSHLGLAVFSMFIGILPLGVLAAINAYLVDVKYFIGDYAGAKKASERAQDWGVISIMGFPVIVMFMVFLISILY